MARTIAITGASGFLGRYLAAAFSRSGAHVRAVVRDPARAAGVDAAEVRLADLADADALRRAFEGADVVVHNAALFVLGAPTWDALRAANVDGTTRSLTAAADVGVTRNVLISSTAVYGRRILRWTREDTPLLTEAHRGRAWAYAISKAVAETQAWEIANQRGLSMTALRPTAIYGRRDTQLTALALRQLERRFLLVPTLAIPFVHAADVAAAAVRAVDNDASIGVCYNLANPPTSLYAALRELRRQVGGGPWMMPLPVPVWVGYDTSAAARDLGFVPTSLTDGIREVVAGLADATPGRTPPVTSDR
jgi:nucleoside-diphosphate-sugar epimerase